MSNEYISRKRLVSLLREILDELEPQGILLSGGIDSGLLACLMPQLKAITVMFEDRAQDKPYIDILERHLGLRVETVKVSMEEALSAIPTVIRILRSFDPALPNDLAVYFGLKALAERGTKRVATGDGGDELFGGYPYMAEVEDLNGYIKEILPQLYFSSTQIGAHLGVQVVQPYLHPRMVEFSLAVPSEFKIRRDGGKVWEKWILRKALEAFLPEDFAWQEKRPLEIGSGMAALRSRIAQGISDGEFREKAEKYRMTFYCKEHLYFYEIFREVVNDIPPPSVGEIPCPNCGAGKPPGRKHCRVCGVMA